MVARGLGLLVLLLPVCTGSIIATEQEATTLRPSRLLVQLITEPENLIRLFEGLDLSFEMVRHWARSGLALVQFRVPVIDYHPPGYAPMAPLRPGEAPRYLKMYKMRNR